MGLLERGGFSLRLYGMSKIFFSVKLYVEFFRSYFGHHRLVFGDFRRFQRFFMQIRCFHLSRVDRKLEI
jgi:hypothetical protein